MKRFKNLVIGGIQNKVFNLILGTVLLLTVLFSIVAMRHSNMLARLAAETGARQQASIEEITSSVMDQVVAQSLERSNRAEARFADGLFEAARARVTFLGDRAAKLLAHPEEYAPQPYGGPDPADDGRWTAKVIYADGVDPSDPAIAAKLGLLANLADTMISLCPALGAKDMYIALPEGVLLSVSETSSGWFVDGGMRSYDPRQREWYILAAEAGGVVFSNGELDADTGAYCVECAAPVYGPDGGLQAVVGTDLYLDEMEQVMSDSALEGKFSLLINRDGEIVLSIGENAPSPTDGALRASADEFLAGIAESALRGEENSVAMGEMYGGAYYVAATPIESTGWVLISAYNQVYAGQPAALLVDSFATIQSEATAAYQESTGKSQLTATVLLIAAALLTLTGALVLSGRIVKPLNNIVRRISELREGDLEFQMEDAYRTGDEIEELAESFAALSHKTVQYVDTVRRVTAEKERIGAELSLATDIQAAMLPHIFPAFPDRSEFDIFACMDPAKEVGGDFYDYFLVDDDHLCMVIADVSGKGVPAALFMMASKIILQSVAMLGNAPAEILARTNEAICSNNEAQMFVTVWLGILELSTGKLTCANAGHEYPVLREPGGAFTLCKDRHGFVIGGMEGVRYREYTLQLERGAKLFVYTDGVPEATNDRKELFGTERMLEALNAQPDAAPADVLKNVRRAVDGFVQDAEQFDDLTMLCLEYRGAQAKGETGR